jgi:murein DD-endopeptidase MepM/ murein hydrolase activator NlpD
VSGARSVLWCAVAALVVAAPGAAWSQAAPVLSWAPATPLQGSLVSIVVTPPDAHAFALASARLGHEPLHFERGVDGVLRALGGVGLGTRDSVVLEIVVQDDAGEPQRVTRWIRLARRINTRERIRTAPEFTAPKGVALAARIAEERQRMSDVYRQTHDTPRLWRERFVQPVPGAVTSAFGARRVVNGVEGARHRGVDLDGLRGTPVQATNRGVVALVGDFFYGGSTVLIDHGAGLVTGYHHLSAILVAQGDTVQPRQILGRVGATGQVTGPHLHWLAHYGRAAVDPMDLPSLKPLPAP